MDQAPQQRSDRRLAVAAGLLAIYVVWGSTYLAIRVMVDDDAGNVPPMFATSSRFAIATALMVAWLLLRRGVAPLRVRRDELRNTLIVGVTLLAGGTGLVNVAEQQVPSGLTALIVAAVPLIVVLMRALTGERVGRATLASVGVGFVGVSLLLAPGVRLDGVALLPCLVVVAASFSWSLGSFLSGRLAMPQDPAVSTILQMVFGTIACVSLGLVTGELGGLSRARWDTDVLLALAYLVVFGSIVAFSAFVWLLRNAPVSTVATYAYVNPMVALALGWALLDERITLELLIASAVIVASVAATIRHEGHSRPAESVSRSRTPSGAS